jgi:hypothetical protein
MAYSLITYQKLKLALLYTNIPVKGETGFNPKVF